MRRTLASKTLGYIKPRVNLQVDNLEVFLSPKKRTFVLWKKRK
jgi:hypothetical protein